MAIYFVQAGVFGPIKIGTSRNVDARIAGLQTANPETLFFVGALNKPASFERKLHQRFSRLRLRGEWFRYCDEIWDEIARLLRAEPDYVPDQMESDMAALGVHSTCFARAEYTDTTPPIPEREY